MRETIEALDNHFGVFLVAFGLVMFILFTLIRSVVTIFTTASREKTRREVAAYIAEGSISPEQGERILRVRVNGRDDGGDEEDAEA